MLVIRMQRTGRKGHAQFRVVVQDSRFSPTSGRVVEYLGSYNPHSKTTTLDKEKASAYLSNGAQPSDRVVKLLKSEGVKLPSWVKEPGKKESSIKHPEKMRKNRPEEPAAEAEAPADDAATEAPAQEQAEVAQQTDEQTAPTENEAPAEPEVETPVEPAQPATEPETPAET